jgi:hypothetical protein
MRSDLCAVSYTVRSVLHTLGHFSPLEADRAESALSQGLDPWTQPLLYFSE